MKAYWIASSALLLLALGCAAARRAVGPSGGSAAQVSVTPASAQPVSAGPLETFTGSVSVRPLYSATEHTRGSAASVAFQPGARSAWHSHPAGQTLVVTEGAGWIQQWGGERQAIKTGDVVWTPPNVKHWHGASADRAMTHLAIQEHVEGKAVDWMEHVTDEQYAGSAGDRSSAALLVAPSSGGAAPAESQRVSAALSAKEQAIPLIAFFTATGDLPRLNAALNQGLDANLTVSEAKEVLAQLYAYVGFPRSLNALGELMKVVEARRLRGVADAPGREPTRVVPTGEALVAVGRSNQARLFGGPVQGALFDFAPVANHFLQAHLFGGIFERDNLDWQSRELATIGALAATPGLESQLRSHLAASIRVGLTEVQLRDVTKMLALRATADAGARAETALNQALSAIAAENRR